MPATTFACPKCGKVLKTAQPIPAGKKIKCPTCAAIFAMPANQGEKLATEVGAKPRTAPPPARDEDDAAPPRRKPSRAAEEDEEAPPARKRPRDEEEDEPRARQRSRDEDEEDEDDRPRGKKKAKKQGSTALVIGGIAVVLVLLLGGGAVGAYFLWFADNKKGKGTESAGQEKQNLTGVNDGSGNEEPLAFVPKGSDILAGFDVAAVMSDPVLGPEIDKSLRGQANDEGLDKLLKETGLEVKELFAKTIVATNTGAAIQGFGMGGGMPAGGGGRGGMPGGRGGMPGGMAPPGGMGAPGSVAATIVLRPSREFDQKKAGLALKGAVAKSSHGKAYYEVNEGQLRTVFMPSNRTLVLSTLSVAELESVITSDGTTPNLSAELAPLVRSVEKNTVWAVVGLNGILRSMLVDSLGKNLKANDPSKLLLDEVAKANGVAAWVSLGEQVRIGVDLVCADDQSATRAAQAAENAWKELKKQLAVYEAALIFLPKTAKAYNEAKASLKFASDGATARVSASVNRAAIMNAIPELQKLAQQGGGAGAGGGGGRGGRGGNPRGGRGGQ